MKRNDFYRKNQVAKRGMAWLMILVMTLGLISLGDVTPVKAANVSSGGYTYGVSEETFQDRIDDILTTVCAGTPPAGHQQGIAVDDSLTYLYASFTTQLVKVDLTTGEIVGSVSGWSGHLGDIAYYDGRIYGSMFWERAGLNECYIAVFDCDQIAGEMTNYGDVIQTMKLFDVKTEAIGDETVEHYYGINGIDGVAFGTIPGDTSGEIVMMVSCGQDLNEEDHPDRDYQIMLQYNTNEFLELDGKGSTQLKEGVSDTPADNNCHEKGLYLSDKYFVYTGNTQYGVQNLEYDTYSGNYIMTIYNYNGASSPYNSEFPNYNMFYVDASVAPQVQTLKLGALEGHYASLGGVAPDCSNRAEGKVLTLASVGSKHEASGIWGSNSGGRAPAYGIDHIYGDYFYISKANGGTIGYDLLYKYDRVNDTFTKVNRNVYEADVEYDIDEDIIAVEGDHWVGDYKVHGLVYCDFGDAIGSGFTAYTPNQPTQSDLIHIRFANPIDSQAFENIKLKMMYNNGATIYAYKEGETSFVAANAVQSFTAPAFSEISFATADYAIDGAVSGMWLQFDGANANFFLDSVTLVEGFKYEAGVLYDANADIMVKTTTDTSGAYKVHGVTSITYPESYAGMGLEGEGVYTTAQPSQYEMVHVQFVHPIDVAKFDTIKLTIMYNNPSTFYAFAKNVTEFTKENAGAIFTTGSRAIELKLPVKNFAVDGKVSSILFQLQSANAANFFVDSLELFQYEPDVVYDASSELIGADAESTLGGNKVHALALGAISDSFNTTYGTAGSLAYTGSALAQYDMVRVRFLTPIDSNKFSKIKIRLMYNNATTLYAYSEQNAEFTEATAATTFTTTGRFIETTLLTSDFAVDGMVESIVLQVRTSNSAQFFMDQFVLTEGIEYEADVEYDVTDSIFQKDHTVSVEDATVRPWAGQGAIGLGTEQVMYTAGANEANHLEQNDVVVLKLVQPIDVKEFNIIQLKVLVGAVATFSVYGEKASVTETNAGATFTTNGKIQTIDLYAGHYGDEEGKIHYLVLQLTSESAVQLFVDSMTLSVKKDYYEVSEYRSGENYTHPEKEGCVFAGWYTDEAYTTPLEEDVTSGTFYAKFVDEKVLSVKCQLSKGTSAESATANLRVLTSVDSLNFLSVGFVLKKEGELSAPVTSKYVYETIYGNVNGVRTAYKASNVFSSKHSKYFMTHVVGDIPQEVFDVDITVIPMWETLDGTVVTGVERTIKISDGFTTSE